MNTTPHGFLVGITRVIAIYFGIRSIDQLTAGIFAYHLQSSMMISKAPEMVNNMPSVFAIYIPAFLFYVALTVAVWFVAARICRMAVSDQSVQGAEHQDVLVLNSVMIFLMGTFFVGWGITRTAEDFTPYFRARANHEMFTLNVGTQIHIVISLLLICFGSFFMSRYATIHRWIDSRSLTQGENGKPPEVDAPPH